jgi:hypothetical protein
MLRRSSSNPCDPTGLLYQTWLHDFYCSAGPHGTGIHSTWDFLPWHRAFLYFHERILADASGWQDFRLPVWDWEKRADMPPLYCDLGLPSFLTGGYQRVLDVDNMRAAFSPCALQAWLLSNRFEDFCGSAGTNLRSALGPHDVVHTGLVRGAMKLPMTAAADPVFYAHHANVDRFWSYWLSHYKDSPGFQIPEDWKRQSYCFYDEKRQLVSLQAGQLLVDSDLGYDYWEPKLDLYDFVPLPELLMDSTQLFNSLGALLAGNLICNGVADLAHRLEALWTYIAFKGLEAAKKLPQTLLDVADSLMLPLLVQAELNDPQIQAGKYYLVQVRNVGWGKSKSIGGFGLFSHQHGGPQTTEVAIAGCLDAGIVEYLRQGSGAFELIYGEPDEHGTDIAGKAKVMVNAEVQLVAAKQAYNVGKLWASSLLPKLPGLPKFPIF